MSALSLRARLIAGLVVVAVVLAGVGWIVTATTRNHLVEQVDAQLVAATDTSRDGRFGNPNGAVAGPPPPDGGGASGGPPERLSALFEGVVSDDGNLSIVFQPNLPAEAYSTPIIEWDTVVASAGTPFTTDAVDGDVQYRALAVEAGDVYVVRALALADVAETVDRLILLQSLGLLAVVAALAAVAWWVVRLGISPIKAMTHAATEIGDDDLSSRVPEPAATGTEAGALARALNTMLGRIETAVDDQRRTEDRLRRFVADASHELRTPVTTIRGYAELYRLGGLRTTDDLDDAMRRTEQEAQRMARLVEDMLTLAKLDQQRPRERTDVDVNALVTDTVADARVTAPRHHIDATIEPDLCVVGDRDLLQQVLVNLVSNATVHTPTGTSVTVAARRHDGHVVVEVADDGPGIDPDDLARLTERFYRADASRTRARGGSGLGLSIAEAALDAHGGTLRIASEPGEGTTATLRIPPAG